MIRLYFQQALYHLRENPIITWVSVLGTALAICMIMVLVITFQVRLVDCEPEVNRSRSLYVSAMSVKNKGGSDGDSSNARMSVRTGRECFKSLTTAEAVTLVSLPEKVTPLIYGRWICTLLFRCNFYNRRYKQGNKPQPLQNQSQCAAAVK